jgi:hypothetical protein
VMGRTPVCLHRDMGLLDFAEVVVRCLASPGSHGTRPTSESGPDIGLKSTPPPKAHGMKLERAYHPRRDARRRFGELEQPAAV